MNYSITAYDKNRNRVVWLYSEDKDTATDICVMMTGNGRYEDVEMRGHAINAGKVFYSSRKN